MLSGSCCALNPDLRPQLGGRSDSALRQPPPIPNRHNGTAFMSSFRTFTDYVLNRKCLDLLAPSGAPRFFSLTPVWFCSAPFEVHMFH